MPTFQLFKQRKADVFIKLSEHVWCSCGRQLCGVPLRRKLLIPCKLRELFWDWKSFECAKERGAGFGAPKLGCSVSLPGKLLSELGGAPFRRLLCIEPLFDLLLAMRTPIPILGETASPEVLCSKREPGIGRMP